MLKIAFVELGEWKLEYDEWEFVGQDGTFRWGRDFPLDLGRNYRIWDSKLETGISLSWGIVHEPGGMSFYVFRDDGTIDQHPFLWRDSSQQYSLQFCNITFGDDVFVLYETGIIRLNSTGSVDWQTELAWGYWKLLESRGATLQIGGGSSGLVEMESLTGKLL